MAKELRNDLVEIEGIKTVAERTVKDTEVTYKPYGKYHKGLDVNEVVYDLMIIAAYDQLKTGQAVYAGDWTAAEMAGTVAAGIHQFVENVNEEWMEYSLIVIRTGSFMCSFHPAQTFQTIAEWEGAINLSPKKYHRFAVEGKEMPKDVKIKAYTRCHCYKPKQISLTAENDRIAKKFEVLGAVAKSLTSEGMKRALSVIEAAYFWDKASYEMRDMARRAMEWKLWKDYGREPGMQPIHFTTQDLKFGPEIWKQVDKDYVIELRKHFQRMLDAAPMPEWPKQGDVVMLKGREKMAKNYQGKFLCEGCVAMLSTYGDRIEWRASVRTKKYDCEYFYPSQLEPAPEVKPKTSSVSHQTSTEPTLAERLREALLKQMQKAA